MIIEYFDPHIIIIFHVQAPVSMRAMCQAMWLLTVSFGDLIVIVIAESSLFESRVSDCTV